MVRRNARRARATGGRRACTTAHTQTAAHTHKRLFGQTGKSTVGGYAGVSITDGGMQHRSNARGRNTGVPRDEARGACESVEHTGPKELRSGVMQRRRPLGQSTNRSMPSHWRQRTPDLQDHTHAQRVRTEGQYNAVLAWVADAHPLRRAWQATENPTEYQAASARPPARQERGPTAQTNRGRATAHFPATRTFLRTQLAMNCKNSSLNTSVECTRAESGVPALTRDETQNGVPRDFRQRIYL